MSEHKDNPINCDIKNSYLIDFYRSNGKRFRKNVILHSTIGFPLLPITVGALGANIALHKTMCYKKNIIQASYYLLGLKPDNLTRNNKILNIEKILKQFDKYYNKQKQKCVRKNKEQEYLQKYIKYRKYKTVKKYEFTFTKKQFALSIIQTDFDKKRLEEDYDDESSDEIINDE